MHTAAATRAVGLAISLLLFAGQSAAAQGAGIKKKVSNIAKGSIFGRAASGLSAEAELLDATTVELDGRGLPTIPVGALTFGVAAVEIKDGEAVRLHAYLLNPGADEVRIPRPTPEMFVLVDEKGRRLERLGGVEAEDQPDAAAIVVPPLERVTLYVLFGDLKADAQTGTLKVGAVGMIGGLPLSTAAAGALPPQQGESGVANPWTQPAESSPYPTEPSPYPAPAPPGRD